MAVMLKGANFPAIVIDRGLNVVIWNSAIATATGIDLDVVVNLDLDDGAPVAFASLPFACADVREQALAVVNDLLRYDGGDSEAGAAAGAAEAIGDGSVAGPPMTRSLDMRLWSTGRGEIVLRMTASLIVLEHSVDGPKGVSLFGQVQGHRRRAAFTEISSLTDSLSESGVGTSWGNEGVYEGVLDSTSEGRSGHEGDDEGGFTRMDTSTMSVVDQLSSGSGRSLRDDSASSGAAEVTFWGSRGEGQSDQEHTRCTSAESSTRPGADESAGSSTTSGSTCTWQPARESQSVMRPSHPLP